MTSVTAQSHAWMVVVMVSGWQAVSSFLFALKHHAQNGHFSGAFFLKSIFVEF